MSTDNPSPASSPVEPSATLEQFLESEAFNAAMYRYRTAPASDQSWVIAAFEDVQNQLRAALRPSEGPQGTEKRTREHVLRLAHRVADISRGNDDIIDDPEHDVNTCEVCGRIADMMIDFFTPDHDPTAGPQGPQEPAPEEPNATCPICERPLLDSAQRPTACALGHCPNLFAKAVTLISLEQITVAAEEK